MKRALIIAAHGSSVNPDAAHSIVELASTLSQRTAIQDRFDFVEARFLAQEPRIRDVHWQSGTTVLPLFMADGHFVSQLRQLIPDSVSLLPPLGTMDLSSAVLANIGRPSRVLLIGHGTKRNQASTRTVETLAETLRQNVEHVTVAFIDQQPALADVWAALPQDDLFVIPYFAFAGPHVTDDIPQLLGLPSGEPGPYNEKGRTIWYGLPVGAMPEVLDALEELACRS